MERKYTFSEKDLSSEIYNDCCPRIYTYNERICCPACIPSVRRWEKATHMHVYTTEDPCAFHLVVNRKGKGNQLGAWMNMTGFNHQARPLVGRLLN